MTTTPGPRTEAGKRLFTDVDPMDMLESDGVTWADILAIEAEARADVDGLVARVEALRDVSEGREFDMLNGAYDRRQGWNSAIDQVLALLVKPDPVPTQFDAGPTHISIEDRERRRIYGQLVDRLWGCDADANAVLDILKGAGDEAAQPDGEVITDANGDELERGAEAPATTGETNA